MENAGNYSNFESAFINICRNRKMSQGVLIIPFIDFEAFLSFGLRD